VLLTHLHVGHYFGLMHFGREAMDWSGLQVHCSAAACDWLCTNQPWRDYVQGGNLTPMQLAPGVPLMLSPALSVTPRLVPHRAEHSDTLSFLVQVWWDGVEGWCGGMVWRDDVVMGLVRCGCCPVLLPS
jgi:pyrroloquinoline quinone biosynthesis protein B